MLMLAATAVMLSRHSYFIYSRSHGVNLSAIIVTSYVHCAAADAAAAAAVEWTPRYGNSA